MECNASSVQQKARRDLNVLSTNVGKRNIACSDLAFPARQHNASRLQCAKQAILSYGSTSGHLARPAHEFPPLAAPSKPPCRHAPLDRANHSPPCSPARCALDTLPLDSLSPWRAHAIASILKGWRGIPLRPARGYGNLPRQQPSVSPSRGTASATPPPTAGPSAPSACSPSAGALSPWKRIQRAFNHCSPRFPNDALRVHGVVLRAQGHWAEPDRQHASVRRRKNKSPGKLCIKPAMFTMRRHSLCSNLCGRHQEARSPLANLPHG